MCVRYLFTTCDVTINKAKKNFCKKLLSIVSDHNFAVKKKKLEGNL